MRSLIARFLLAAVGCILTFNLSAADKIRVATFNVENYLDMARGGRPEKPGDSKAKVRDCVKELKADVIAFQEMGNTNALLELRDSLKAVGVDYPHWEHVTGYDTNIHVAILSKVPFSARRPHTNEAFLLSGRRFQVSRGFAEVDIKIEPNYTFTLFVAHLKSKRTVGFADEAELRLEEARLLREKIDARLTAQPSANIVVVGDFNDTKDMPPVKAIVGSGKTKLIDTRPAERNGDNIPSSNPAWEPRNVTWTHFYGKEDSYARFDYILISPGMANEWVKEDTYILTVPNWGLASDHRPLVATFSTADR